MKIFKSFIFGLMAAATLGGFVSCQDDIDAPEPIAPVAENLDKVNTTIFDFKKEYWQDDQNYCKQVGTKPDGEHIYIKGRVISSDESGNVFKSIVIQDETAALAFSVNAYNLFLDHRVGQEVVVDLTGMYVGKYNNLMQMGWPDEYQDGLQTTFMSPEFFKAHVENNGMPDAIAQLLNEGKVQLFCADAMDGEGLLNGDLPQRRRAELQEKYFVYLTAELAPRILTLNNAKKGTRIWTAGVDLGAYHAVHCRLRRPTLFAGAVGMGGIYDLTRFWGTDSDDMVLRCAPLSYLQENGIANKPTLAKAEENSLILCAGQGAYEGDALDDTQALADLLKDQGMPAHLEIWGGDVSHDWYWWGKMWSLFAPRILEVK